MTMKLVIFDVNNAACGLAVCPNGYSLMVDCGSHSEKICPVDYIHILKKKNSFLEQMKQISGYQLTLLHITHPDDDHVKNAKKVKESLQPYMLQRRKSNEFPKEEKIHDEYKAYLDTQYNTEIISEPERGWSQSKTWRIPMNIILENIDLYDNVKNNSSILRYIEYGGTKILFGGDLETNGRNWLIKNDEDFIQTMKKGIDIFIAPHHGHKSGFPKALFDLMGDVKVVIHSKATESNIDGTDVSSQYSDFSKGLEYKNINDGNRYIGKVLTTRSNGSIYMSIDYNQNIYVQTDKASSNHRQL